MHNTRNYIRQLLERASFQGMPNINNAFYAWFGDSKMVDDEGLPAIYFHGTQADEDFSEFAVGDYVGDPDSDGYLRLGSGADPTAYLGSHFAVEDSVASRFASGMYGERQGRSLHKGRVIPVYLRIEKPYKTSDTEIIKEMLRGSYDARSIDSILDYYEDYDLDYFFDTDNEDMPDQDEIYKLYDTNEEFRIEVNNMALSSENQYDSDGSYELAREMAYEYQKKLKSKGYDGVIYKNDIEGGTSVIAFEPSQIKSIYNNGTWNQNSKDIMK